jgi:hypothetical protein
MVTPHELDFLEDDIEVAPPEEYADQTSGSVIPEGTYNLLLTDFDATRNYETKVPDGKGYVLHCVVADGPLEGRQVRNLRVWSAPYVRNGVKVSGLGDLIRAIDVTVPWKTREDVRQILQKAIDTKQTFRVKLLWTAFDTDHFNSNGGPMMERKSPEEKILRKESTVKYMKNFRQMPDGSFYPETVGPSGATLEARLEFGNFIPSNKRK